MKRSLAYILILPMLCIQAYHASGPTLPLFQVFPPESVLYQECRQNYDEDCQEMNKTIANIALLCNFPCARRRPSPIPFLYPDLQAIYEVVELGARPLSTFLMNATIIVLLHNCIDLAQKKLQSGDRLEARQMCLQAFTTALTQLSVEAAHASAGQDIRDYLSGDDFPGV